MNFFIFKKKTESYPRSPSVYSSAQQFNLNNPYHPHKLVNQQNLKDLTKVTLYRPLIKLRPQDVLDLGEPRYIK